MEEVLPQKLPLVPEESHQDGRQSTLQKEKQKEKLYCLECGRNNHETKHCRTKLKRIKKARQNKRKLTEEVKRQNKIKQQEELLNLFSIQANCFRNTIASINKSVEEQLVEQIKNLGEIIKNLVKKEEKQEERLPCGYCRSQVTREELEKDLVCVHSICKTCHEIENLKSQQLCPICVLEEKREEQIRRSIRERERELEEARIKKEKEELKKTKINPTQEEKMATIVERVNTISKQQYLARKDHEENHQDFQKDCEFCHFFKRRNKGQRKEEEIIQEFKLPSVETLKDLDQHNKYHKNLQKDCKFCLSVQEKWKLQDEGTNQTKIHHQKTSEREVSSSSSSASLQSLSSKSSSSSSNLPSSFSSPYSLTSTSPSISSFASPSCALPAPIQNARSTQNSKPDIVHHTAKPHQNVPLTISNAMMSFLPKKDPTVQSREVDEIKSLAKPPEVHQTQEDQKTIKNCQNRPNNTNLALPCPFDHGDVVKNLVPNQNSSFSKNRPQSTNSGQNENYPKQNFESKPGPIKKGTFPIPKNFAPKGYRPPKK